MSAQRPRGVKRNHLSMADGDSASVSDHSEDESPPGRLNKRQRGDDDGGSDDQPTATSTISALGEETRFITITGSGEGGEDGAGGDSVPATVWSDDDGEAASWCGGEGSLTRVTGDLLEAGEDYICHQVGAGRGWCACNGLLGGEVAGMCAGVLDATPDPVSCCACLQTNCKSRGARGLAKALFARFPWANIYTDGSARIPGDIVVRHSPTGAGIGVMTVC